MYLAVIDFFPKDPKILPKLAGYQLCMVKAVGQAGEDEPTYNVVCSTTGEFLGSTSISPI